MAGHSADRVACRDCTAVVDALGRLDHDLSCPRGVDMEATGEDDVRWFREHPGQTVRRRPLAWSEAESLADYNELLENYTVTGIVSVRRVAHDVLNCTLDELRAIRKEGAPNEPR